MAFLWEVHHGLSAKTVKGVETELVELVEL